jgi:GNAT superfamily N-acetyltransferase
MDVVLRPLAPGDSIEALTALLHRAYAPLGAAGMNYTAVDQGVEATAERVAGVHCLVAERAGAIVGTVTVNGPWDAAKIPGARRCPWYLRPDLAHLHQLAVEPALQGHGIGARLIAACEDWAQAQGHVAIALDTAMPAAHLRARYARLGYVDAGSAQWAGKRYRSVIMVKPLGARVPCEDDDAYRCALVRAYWAHIQARDWPSMRESLHDDAALEWPVTSERFDGADLIVRVNAEYPEGWSIDVRDVQALADGRSVLSQVDVPHGADRFFALSMFVFRGTRIAALREHWAAADAPPAWRSAERLGAGYHVNR